MPQAHPSRLLPPSPFPVRAAIRQLLRLQPRLDLHLAMSWKDGASFTASVGPRAITRVRAGAADGTP